MQEKVSEELPSLFQYLWALLKNPVQEIQNIPKINWPTLVIFQFCLSLVSVVVSNLLAPFAISFTNVLISLIIALLATALVTLFLYYFFLILFQRQLSFISIFTLVLFAHIPFAIFHLAAYFFPPVDLIGLGISALLMVIGLVENFNLPRKICIRLMISLYAVFFVYWSISLVTSRNHREDSKPKSLDRLEQEVQDAFGK